MLLVGGLSTLLGPVAAAFGIVFLSEYLERFPNIEAVKHMALAVIIILVLRFFPGGLAQAFELFGRRIMAVRLGDQRWHRRRRRCKSSRSVRGSRGSFRA